MNELAINGGTPVITYDLPTVKDISGRDVGDEEMALVSEVIRSGNMGYLYGTKVKEFQRQFAARYGVSTAVAVSSGTAALHTAMAFLDIGPGDEVLVPAITDMGTILGVLLQNAVPVFVDVDWETQNVDPDDIERHINERTKAIMVVHLYGMPCDMDRIMPIARKHNLYVVEDCAQAHLTEYKGKLVGTIGDIGCFSFQQSKQMTTGDGGMIITNQEEICGRKLQHCCDKAWPREKYRDHLFLAPNYHMTELQAAVGIAQFNKLPQFIYNRRKTAMHLSDLVKDIKGVYVPGDRGMGRHTYYEYPLVIDSKEFTADNKTLAEALTAEGVKTAPSYLPYPIYMYDVVYKMRTYNNTRCPYSCPLRSEEIEYSEDMCPTAVQACKDMLYIPLNEKMTEKHAEDIAAAVRKVLTYYQK